MHGWGSGCRIQGLDSAGLISQVLRGRETGAHGVWGGRVTVEESLGALVLTELCRALPMPELFVRGLTAGHPKDESSGQTGESPRDRHAEKKNEP